MSLSLSRREVLAMMGATSTLTALAATDGRTAFKTIGVLGGIGPQATMDFEARVHFAAQRLVPQRENSGYPPMVVYYHRHPPILVNEDLSPRFPIRPDPAPARGGRAPRLLGRFPGDHLERSTPHSG